MILGGTFALILVKFAISLALARYHQNSFWRNSTLFSGWLLLAQGGEFALLALVDCGI